MVCAGIHLSLIVDIFSSIWILPQYWQPFAGSILEATTLFKKQIIEKTNE